MMNDIETNHSSFLRKFLIEPEFRVLRHILLIVILVVISFNQAFFSLTGGKNIAYILSNYGDRFYLLAFYLCIAYSFVTYFNIYFLLPRFLLKKKYGWYVVYLLLSVLLLVIFQTVIEEEDFSSPITYLETFSVFMLVAFCIYGVGMTVLLKYWIVNNQRVSQLEKLHVESELEQLKEQVNPHLLFNVLNKTGVLAKQNPEEASAMLLRLSQLLRYQLYDCRMDKVLLSAEIKFLTNYMALEQSYSGLFEYTIQSDKNSNRILVSPLLFISFVQTVVQKMNEQSGYSFIHINFETKGNGIFFTCKYKLNNTLKETSFSRIIHRLDLLYKNNYSLFLKENDIELQLNLKHA